MSAKLNSKSITMRATRKVAQLVDSTWAAVASTVGQGVFLIRRCQGQQPGQCPFLCCEVTRQR